MQKQEKNQHDLKNLGVLIVIYNELLSNSPSYTFISQHQHESIVFIVDNSTDPVIITENMKVHKDKTLVFCGQGNIGLSKAYNKIIDHIENSYSYLKWLLILDQDTELNLSYLSEIVSLCDEKWNVVYFPTVLTQKRQLSPSLLGKLGKSKLTKLHEEKSIPINSGTLWERSIFKSIRFNENLFLDLVDFDVFCQVYASKDIIDVIPMRSTLFQNFSDDMVLSNDKDLLRFKIYVKDFTTFSTQWEYSFFSRYKILIKRAIKLSIRHKNLSYIWVALIK